MTLLIVKKQFKEFFKNKANGIFIIILLIICGIFIPVFYIKGFYSIVLTLVCAFVSQIAPALFAGEKENRTLETLITLPIKIKNIYLGKVIFCFIVCIALMYISFFLGGLISVISGIGIDFVYSFLYIIIYLIFIPISIWNLSYHSVYLSLKANDVRVCALELTFAGIAYAILPIAVLTLASDAEEYPMEIILLLYLLIELGIFIILRKSVKKYLKKPVILGLLRN